MNQTVEVKEQKEEVDSHIIKTKKQIADRNKDNEAINSHVITLQGNMLGLVIVYKNGTYDKHIVNFNRQSYITFIGDEKKKIIRYKKEVYKMVPVEGEQNG